MSRPFDPARLAALATGAPTFNTGRPCKYGHVAPRRAKNSACTACEATRHLRRYTTPEAVEAHRAYERQYRAAAHPKNPKVRMLKGAKTRAKAHGVPFKLTTGDFDIPEVCPALGIPLRCSPGKMSDNSPTLDRFVPARGYIRGNVVVISWRANRIKNNASARELRALADWTQLT